jgi:pyrimidine-nucleoside phosphorylase
MTVYELLTKKRDGVALSADELRWFIEGFTREEITDYQMAAFLMAVAIRGMEPDEILALTTAMIESGEQWRLRDHFDFIADKHSSGGVGDKISLTLTPWVAACGVKIAMLSGRGLGHTGGTLDNLDAIPGFSARLSREELERCVDTVGGAIATSTKAIAPADRRMYALRDVTATVESIPLITASIMSKKLAMGASALILDVKFGSGAFMKTEAEARLLAQSLIEAGRGSGTRVEALLTSMEAPLGIAVGNANEVIEAIDVLRTRKPHDLYELTKAQAVRILVMSGRFDEAAADVALEKAIDSGAALQKAHDWIAIQGGDPAFIDNPELLARPRRTLTILSQQDGWIESLEPYAIGMLAVELGAGRMKQEDVIDPAAGIRVLRNAGDAVQKNEPIAEIEIGAREVDDELVEKKYRAALTISEELRSRPPLITALLTGKSDRRTT